MSSVTTPDRDLAHLFPAFRAKLQLALAETAERTECAWQIVEGYRSNERQLWLFAQGRTRTGPVVTWMRTPKHHGAGLAADVMPSIGYAKATPRHWAILQTSYLKQGLENPAWHKGDLGHVQWPAADRATHNAALAWVRGGFKPAPTGKSPIYVYAGAHLVPDADGKFIGASVFVALRPIADALGYAIAEVKSGNAYLVDDDGDLMLPLRIDRGRGYVAVRDLEGLARVTWEPKLARVTVEDL